MMQLLLSRFLYLKLKLQGEAVREKMFFLPFISFLPLFILIFRDRLMFCLHILFPFSILSGILPLFTLAMLLLCLVSLFLHF